LNLITGFVDLWYYNFRRAFAGRSKVLEAYRHAVMQKYRFCLTA